MFIQIAANILIENFTIEIHSNLPLTSLTSKHKFHPHFLHDVAQIRPSNLEANTGHLMVLTHQKHCLRLAFNDQAE